MAILTCIRRGVYTHNRVDGRDCFIERHRMVLYPKASALFAAARSSFRNLVFCLSFIHIYHFAAGAFRGVQALLAAVFHERNTSCAVDCNFFRAALKAIIVTYTPFDNYYGLLLRIEACGHKAFAGIRFSARTRLEVLFIHFKLLCRFAELKKGRDAPLFDIPV